MQGDQTHAIKRKDFVLHEKKRRGIKKAARHKMKAVKNPQQEVQQFHNNNSSSNNNNIFSGNNNNQQKLFIQHPFKPPSSQPASQPNSQAVILPWRVHGRTALQHQL